MIASETDLYACGEKVYIPSPRSRPVRDKDVQQASVSNTPRFLSPGESTGLGIRKSKHPSPLNSHVRELGKTLAFSDDIVSEVSPHLVSYSKSKGAIKSLFRPDDLGIKTHPNLSQADTGRHDCRGQPKRHLPCHLLSPTEDNHVYKSKSKVETTSNQREWSDTSVEQISDANTGLYVAPSAKSVIWEDEILGKVSSSTARRLQGQPSHLSIDNTNQPIPHHSSLITQNASTLFSNIFSEDEVDELVSPPPRDYLTEYRDGARPVHQNTVARGTLVLDSGAQFDTVVQDCFPYSPSEWCQGEAAEKSEKKVENVKGYQKWLDFPKPIQTAEDLHWQCRDISDLPASETSLLNLQQSSHSRTSSLTFKNQEFFEIMHEWCSKWQIHLQLKDITSQESILTDVHNLCDTTRMIAVASIALLAEHQVVADTKSTMSVKNSYSSASGEVAVSGEMVEALCGLLDDAAEHVRVPSAITLYCMDRQSQKAEEVLLSAVSGASHVESWASVQCLARAGVASLVVVEELLKHLQDHTRARTTSQLLASLSSKTGLVHSLLSERLNCSGWLERLASCQMLPKLHGGINKDVCHKLVHLAWNDWSPEVRTGAAQALGLTGHGKMIHDEIGRRLTDESETTRLDALKKLQSLNLMTTQLLSTYLSCFSDTHTSIRIQAVKMAGALKLTHPKVQEALLSLLVNDPSWKVKVTTLQAMAECGQRDESLVSQLVWVVRFEKLAAVRAEGCRTIARLGLKEERVVQTLRDLLTVEDDPIVKREVSSTLEELGCDAAPGDDMLDMIRSEVKRLGTQETITAEVLGSDRSNTTQRIILGTSKPPLTTRDLFNQTKVRKRRSEPITSHQPQDGTCTTVSTGQGSVGSSTCNSRVQMASSEGQRAGLDDDLRLKDSLKQGVEGLKGSHKQGVEGLKGSHKQGVERLKGSHKQGVEGLKGSHKQGVEGKLPPRGERERRDKVWSPDREMIDNHLEMMRKRVSTVDIAST